MPNGTCRECAAPTPPSKRGKPLMYCSKYCANKRFVLAYKRRRPKSEREYFDCVCVVCEANFRGARRVTMFCSNACKGQHYSETMKRKCVLPDDHPVVVLIADAKAEARRMAQQRRRPDYSWRTARECPGCACIFTPLYTPNAVTCSKRCQRRVTKQRRRAREHGARGTFTWSEFMRIAAKFGYCCAYCGDKPKRLDPDHVVPLSRGGSNSPSNLLPACNMCNSSKCAMTLSEWAAWLADRDMPARRTVWLPGDPRYVHLTEVLLSQAA